MLLNCYWVVCTSFEAVVVCHDHALFSTDVTYTSDDVSAWYTFALVHIVISCKLPNLNKWTAWVNNGVYSLTGQQFVSLFGYVSLPLADIHRLSSYLVKLGVELSHSLVVLLVVSTVSVDILSNDFHHASLELWKFVEVDATQRCSTSENFLEVIRSLSCR